MASAHVLLSLTYLCPNKGCNHSLYSREQSRGAWEVVGWIGGSNASVSGNAKDHIPNGLKIASVVAALPLNL